MPGAGATRLSRVEASAAIDGSSWRLVLGAFRRVVACDSLTAAARIVTSLVAALSRDASAHLELDVRPRRVSITVRSPGGAVTDADVAILRTIDAVLGDLPSVSGGIRVLEVAIDAIDVPAVRRFWQAVTGFELGEGGDLLDPSGQLPAIWFQQMDEPRPDRNRIHFDLSVPHDEADAVVAAGLAAGGTLVSDAEARAFWILADPEGNEVCVCTWQDRD
jgi:4a-hydroxytetrahydrobiopterin dehydratase